MIFAPVSEKDVTRAILSGFSQDLDEIGVPYIEVQGGLCVAGVKD